MDEIKNIEITDQPVEQTSEIINENNELTETKQKSFKDICLCVLQAIGNFFKWLSYECPVLKQILNSKSIVTLIVKVVVMYIIAYAWVWIAAFIWDDSTITEKIINMIFTVLCILFALAVVLSIWSITLYIIKAVKKHKNKKTNN